jgi:thiosulfate dehydrogenase [quinone] large subunit
MLKKTLFLLALYPTRLPKYTTTQLTGLVVLRVLIGWHFLYEGVVKVLNPYWSSAGFLLETKGIFSGLATSIVASPTALGIVDFINMWGLIAIGLGLIAGCLTRIAGISGIVLLFFYYNKNLIEMCALFVLTIFPTGTIIGLDRLIFIKKKPE